MTEEMFDRIARYRAMMAMVKKMLEDGIILEEEYREIDRMYASEYGLDLSVIYR